MSMNVTSQGPAEYEQMYLTRLEEQYKELQFQLKGSSDRRLRRQ